MCECSSRNSVFSSHAPQMLQYWCCISWHRPHLRQCVICRPSSTICGPQTLHTWLYSLMLHSSHRSMPILCVCWHLLHTTVYDGCKQSQRPHIVQSYYLPQVVHDTLQLAAVRCCSHTYTGSWLERYFWYTSCSFAIVVLQLSGLGAFAKFAIICRGASPFSKYSMLMIGYSR